MRRAGLTLIELLVALAVVGVVVGLALGAVQATRRSAARLECQSRLRQLALACHSYHQSHGRLPPGHVPFAPPNPGKMAGATWATHLLPFLERDELWRQAQAAFQQDPLFHNGSPHVGLATVVPAFTCPVDRRLVAARTSELHQYSVALMSFLGVAGTRSDKADGVLYSGSATRLGDVSDGTSSTLLIGERPPDKRFNLGWWYAGAGLDGRGTWDSVMGVAETDPVPATLPPCGTPGMSFRPAGGVADRCAPFHFWSLHAGGGHFAACDGSVRLLRYESSAILPALSTRAGGEPPPDAGH